MEDAVQLLESLLLPEFDAFAESLSRTLPGVAVRNFSHRHADELHSLGLSCFPVGSDELDERSVALIANVIGVDGLVVKGYVQWQGPSFYREAVTPLCKNPRPDELTAFSRSVHGLLGSLRAAAQRGTPPGVAWRGRTSG